MRDSLFDQNQEAGMGHIELARWPDVIVIAPCSAETLAKLRMGRADDLLTTLVLATDKPILLAPAMNRLMWSNAATQENVAVLTQRGFEVLAPASGEQACGEVGEGRMPEPQDIFNKTLENLEKRAKNNQAWLNLATFWAGKSILITAGPTFEAIDPVRFIGNRSSGKMGFAIAQVAAELGAEVTLIAGPVHLPTPKSVMRLDVESAEQMLRAVQAHYQTQTVFISAAAVADYRVEQVSEHKLKKKFGVDSLSLELVKNPDIVAWVAAQADKPFVVGFAAETQNVLAYAQDKLVRKNLDMICANQVGQAENGQLLGFNQDSNALTLITKERHLALPESAKSLQALALLKFLAEQF